MSAQIEMLEEEAQFQVRLQENPFVLVDFYADWCEPCKWLEPILDDVGSKTTLPLLILKVDTDKFLSISREFNLRSVPVLMFFKNGTLAWRMNGFLLADALVEKIEAISRGTEA